MHKNECMLLNRLKIVINKLVTLLYTAVIGLYRIFVIDRKVDAVDGACKSKTKRPARLRRATCFCPSMYYPVCGMDGNTYSNACWAFCRYVRLQDYVQLHDFCGELIRSSVGGPIWAIRSDGYYIIELSDPRIRIKSLQSLQKQWTPLRYLSTQTKLWIKPISWIHTIITNRPSNGRFSSLKQ